MKKLFVFLLFFFFSNLSLAESYCDLSKSQVSDIEYNSCKDRELKASRILSPIIYSAGENVIEIVNVVFRDIAKKSLVIISSDEMSSDLMMTPAKSQMNVFLNISNKLIEIISMVSSAVFIVAFGVILFILLFRAMTTGVAVDKKDAFFCSIMIGIGIISIYGGLAAIIKIAVLIAIILVITIWAIVSQVIFMFFGYDLDAIKSNLYSEAVVFSDAVVESNYKAHVSDIRAKNKLIFENSTLLDSYGWMLDDIELMNCFNNPINQDVSNKKVYIPKHFIAGSDCVNEELGYQVYKMFRIEDPKDKNSSAAVIQKIDSMQYKIRKFAYYNIHKNNCAAVSNIQYEKFSDYLGVCGNRELDGNYTANENGYIQEFKNIKIIDTAEVMKQKEALKKELATFVYSQMLANAAEVSKGNNRMSSENLVGVMNLGFTYRKNFEKAALEVIDLDIIDDIVVKKNKLQEGYDAVSNMFSFGAEGEDTTFGVNEYMESMTVKSDFKKEIAGLMNSISGNAFTNLGLQYEDCYVKYTCNSGESNVFITINQASSAIVKYSFIAYAAANVYGESKKRSAVKLNSYDRDTYMQGSQMVSLGKFFLVPALLIFCSVAYLLKVNVMAFFTQLFFSFVLYIVLPATVLFSITIYVFRVVIIKDDRESIGDLFARFGVFDALLRAPLIIISTLIALSVVLLVGSIASYLLFAVLGNAVNLYSAEGGIAMMFSSLIFIAIYIVCYIAIIAGTIMKTIPYANTKSDDLLGSSANFVSAINEESGRLKDFMRRAK
jgi:hypothetical protein